MKKYFYSTLVALGLSMPLYAGATTYFTPPAVTTTLQGIADWFNPIFGDFWNWGLIAIGVILGFGVIAWLISHFKGALH